jgi:hypothetical protein
MFKLFQRHVSPQGIQAMSYAELREYESFCDVLTKADVELQKKIGRG